MALYGAIQWKGNNIAEVVKFTGSPAKCFKDEAILVEDLAVPLNYWIVARCGRLSVEKSIHSRTLYAGSPAPMVWNGNNLIDVAAFVAPGTVRWVGGSQKSIEIKFTELPSVSDPARVIPGVDRFLIVPVGRSIMRNALGNIYFGPDVKPGFDRLEKVRRELTEALSLFPLNPLPLAAALALVEEIRDLKEKL